MCAVTGAREVGRSTLLRSWVLEGVRLSGQQQQEPGGWRPQVASSRGSKARVLLGRETSPACTSLVPVPLSVGDPGAGMKRRGVLSQRAALVLSFEGDVSELCGHCRVAGMESCKEGITASAFCVLDVDIAMTDPAKLGQ